MAHVCKACQERVWEFNGDKPRCGFSEGPFNPDNWNCATLNALRDLVDESQHPMPDGVDYRYCSDQKYATVHIDDVELNGDWLGLALWVSWYKNRGTTEAVWILDHSGVPRQPSEAEVLAILESYGRTATP